MQRTEYLPAATAPAAPATSIDAQDPRASGVGPTEAPDGHTSATRVALRGSRGTQRRSRGFSPAQDHRPQEPSFGGDLNQEPQESSGDSWTQVGWSCLGIALVLFTGLTELPLLWIEQLVEALR